MGQERGSRRVKKEIAGEPILVGLSRLAVQLVGGFLGLYYKGAVSRPSEQSNVSRISLSSQSPTILKGRE